MADRIKGITIELGADTVGLNKALKDVKGQSIALQKELKDVDRLLKFNPGNTEALAQKQKLLADQVANTTQKLNMLKDAEQQVQAQFAKGEISEAQYRAFRREIEFTEGSLDKLKKSLSSLDDGNELKNLAKDAENAKKSVGDLGQRMQDVGGNMQSVGTDIATSFGAGALAIGAGLGIAVNKTMDFEAQLSRVGAIAGSTDTELQALRESALLLGASTSKSATEIAMGQEALAALGFTTLDILGAMPGVISAAEASGSDMAQTAEVMASTLNIFGLEASKATDVADILAKTANISAANLTDMQYALKYAGPPAASLGVSLEELSASIGIMTNAGMQGEQAGTTLRSALLSLLSPSEENSKLMTTMGIAVTDAKGNFVGLSNLIDNLTKSMEGQTETQKAATLASLVGKEAVSGMISLMAAGPSEIDKMTKALQESGGASAEAAGKMKDNLKGAMDELSGSFESMQISIGNALAPAIESVVALLQKLTDFFNGLSPTMQSFVAISAAVTAVILGIVAAIGIVIAIGGSAVTGFGALMTAMGGTAVVTGALGSAFAVITGPIGLLVAAVVGLIAIFVALYKNNEDFKNKVNEIWTSIQKYFKVALDFIGNIVKKVMTEVQQFFGDTLGRIKAFWKENGDQIMVIVSFFMNYIGSHIKMVMGIIQGVFQMVWPIITGVVKIAWETMKLTIKNALDIILGVIQFFVKVFTGDWQGAFDTIKQTAENIMNNIVNTFKNINLRQIGKDIVQGLIDGISSMIGAVMDKARSIADAVKNTIKGALDINSPSRVMRELGGYAGDGLRLGLEDSVRGVMSMSNKLANAVVPNITPIQTPSSPSLNTSNTNSQPAIIQLLLDGRIVAEQTYPDINRLLHRDMTIANRTGGSWQK
ncbi:phage tail tape measure protein [Peribacillus alkalitolerans]|uniref:phage tail tape measure protein n=1 Tax=Peribacillus alkalitolerans TaxID=1550385 RepID=UPI0013D1E1C7|nr:phage tail tape measure protein [Peribacillus alkalitolerans]